MSRSYTGRTTNWSDESENTNEKVEGIKEEKASQGAPPEELVSGK